MSNPQFTESVRTAYEGISNQLSDIIYQEIKHNDKQALTEYDNLIEQCNKELKVIQHRYDCSRLSAVDKVSLNSLLSLKAKIVSRRATVQKRLQKTESYIIGGANKDNANSYSSFMSAFKKKPELPVIGSPTNEQELKLPKQISTTTQSNGGQRSTSNPKATRNSLDLPRPQKPASSQDKPRSRSPGARRERPKSVDLSINQAAILAWDQQQRKVTPPSRPLSPTRLNNVKYSSSGLVRKYDYVQPTINTQINLTRVNGSKSPVGEHRRTPSANNIHKKSHEKSASKNVLVTSNGTKQESTKKIKDVKEFDDPRIQEAMDNLQGVDRGACEQILDEILVTGEKLKWDDLAGLESAKQSLKETVVYPFLRPDLFRGLREPITGMLLFGPPGTGKTMIAKTVANESHSTFFSISASSLLSKYLGESEKLIRALFFMAKKLAPSIIFFDEIDSLLTARSEGEQESSRRVKTEFLIQWSSLSSATANSDVSKSRVLVLAATNLPWAIDEAARRRFTRRLYIPLPEFETRLYQLKMLMKHQIHSLTETDFIIIANQTEGYSNSDITSLAKEAAMEPIRDLGEDLMSINTKEIRGVCLQDFEKAMKVIRKSVAKDTLIRFEQWASNFGSTGA